MVELKTHETISIGIKIVSMVFLIIPMIINVVSIKLSNSNLFTINLTTISADIKLDSSLDPTAQQTIQSSFNSIGSQQLIISLLVIIMLLGSIFLTYKHRNRWSGLLTTIAGIFTFILFIRYFVINTLNGQAAAGLGSNYIVTYGIGYYFLILVTPFLIISALVKFAIRK